MFDGLGQLPAGHATVLSLSTLWPCATLQQPHITAILQLWRWRLVVRVSQDR
jgi:hypothetical protein